VRFYFAGKTENWYYHGVVKTRHFIAGVMGSQSALSATFQPEHAIQGCQPHCDNSKINFW